MLARSLIRAHERERMAWERERLLLIRTVCHLSGSPLPEPDPPPVMNGHDGRVDLELIEDPAQLPDY